MISGNSTQTDYKYKEVYEYHCKQGTHNRGRQGGSIKGAWHFCTGRFLSGPGHLLFTLYQIFVQGGRDPPSHHDRPMHTVKNLPPHPPSHHTDTHIELGKCPYLEKSIVVKLFTTHVIIQTDGCGLLSDVRRIDQVEGF